MAGDPNTWFLVSLAVGPAGRVEYELKDGENVIGRKRDADINLPHLDVSREHSVIFVVNNNNVALIDRNSRNGTFVNGQKVSAGRSVTLFENDSIGFGSNTNVLESYAEKSPFLVFRIIKKIPSRFFEEMEKNRGKGLTKRVAETAPACVPAIKRIKAEHGVAPAPAPVNTSPRSSLEVSSTVNMDEPSCDQASSAGIQVTRSRSDGMVEFCVVDEAESNVGSTTITNHSLRSACNDQSRIQNSLLAKSSDSTTQNGLNSDLEAGTPSFRNSSSRTNDDTRSVQKNQPKDSSAVGSSSEKVIPDHSPAKPSSAKVELFRLPLMNIKKEPRSGTPPRSPLPISPAPNNSRSNGDIPTFSLISDDEDEDEMMSSQMFIKSESESQSLVQPPEEPVVDDEVYEIFDSDDESMFENALSQSFSQSFMVPEEPMELIETPIPPKETKRKDDKIKKKKDDRRGSLPKDDSGTSKDSTKSLEPETSRKPSKPASKKAQEAKKSLKKPKSSKTSKKLSSEGSSKDVPEKSPDKPGSEEDPQRKLRSKPVKESIKASEDFPEIPVGSSKERRSSADSTKLPAKPPKGTEVEKTVQKIIDDSKKKVMAKKAMIVEPHTLSNKEIKQKPVAAMNGTVPALQAQKNRRVTFKEDLTQVKEFECLGNMKKISSVPTQLLKEHPPKLPGLQWNALLLKHCKMIGDICQWNLKWLQEFQLVDVDPPLFPHQPLPISNRFKKFEDYYFTMVALILHELWSELCRTHLFQTESQNFPLFSGIIEHIEPNVDARTLFARVRTVCTPSDLENPLPNFGDLVGIEVLAPDQKRTHLYSSIGVVTKQYSRERLRPSRETNFLISNLAPNKSANENAVVCPIELLFRASKSLSKKVSKDCFVRIRVYRNIMNQVKYFLALGKVSTSPLKSVILDPTKAVNKASENQKDMRIHGQQYLTTNLNKLQREAVLGIANSVLTEESSLNLVHGPPGTGKSSTIASLIVHLLPILRTRRKGPPAKILLCAPSNNAIDELCLKLLEVRKKLKEEDKFKLTRVGNIKMMHPLVADISSHRLALRGLMSTPDPQSLETEMTLLEARIQAGKNSLFGPTLKPGDDQRIRENIEKCETRMAFYRKTLSNINSGRPCSNPEEDKKLFHLEECVIIAGAEIIATTLSSSTSKKILDALSDSNQFSCCIVDEATQATEPEVLIPLNHDIRHLVLVGDPQQLGPTVTSRFAKERNFEWSLYHRLMNEWKQYRGTPLYHLREQYRMHAEIVAFPSAKFYNAELTTPDYLKLNLPFSPYQVISHSWPESAAEESNEKEGRFIVELVQKLMGLPEFKLFEVGIIVPYQNQNRFIRRVIEDKRDRALDKVVVNTIDSFQGQEKDLVILSCVRTKRIGFLSDKQRLNVALTRAKKCLLVVGNFQALKSDEFWAAMIEDAKSRNRFVDANPNDRIAPGIIFSKLFGKNAKVSKRGHHSRT